MASIQPRGSRFQLRVVHKLLPRPFFHTFDSREDAERYGQQLELLLAQGVVPEEMLDRPRAGPPSPLLVSVIGEFLKRGAPAPSDRDLLGVLSRELVGEGLRMNEITFPWVEKYVAGLKARDPKPAPGTIRKRIGSLARVVDWHNRTEHQARQKEGLPLGVNIFRSLPRGYSLYEGREREDVERGFRLGDGDEAKILAVLDGAKRPDRERPFPADPELRLFFELIVNTGLRLREAYWLRVEQFDAARGLLHVDGTKGHRGRIKKRVVPLVRPLREKLAAWVAGRREKMLIFDFWDGTPEDLPRCSSRLSNRFASMFSYAGVRDLTEHDLRHEATCRWIMMRNPGGGWLFSDVEVAKIMGWSSLKMMLRYASLRGEDLSARLP